VRLERLAENINDQYRQAFSFASEAIKNGNAAVRSAIACGKMLDQAKRLIGHGRWLKWLSDNCSEIDERTAQNWMRLSKTKHVSDLENFANLRQAYIACGILPEPEAKTKAIGTGMVDIIEVFAGNITKHISRIYTVLDGVDVQSIPQEKRVEIKAKLSELQERL